MDKNEQAKAKSTIKSGVDIGAFEAVLGGFPEKKTAEQIAKEHEPKTAPNSVRS